MPRSSSSLTGTLRLLRYSRRVLIKLSDEKIYQAEEISIIIHFQRAAT
ncbi:hypothetical protein [Candidatus Korarchaeum cryptofilum]|nr:hypothetical protein [Candidatus Korarchaeum cryptofilum]